MDKKDLKNVNVGLQLLVEAIGLPVLVANLLCLKEEPLASAGRGKGVALSSLDFTVDLPTILDCRRLYWILT